MELRASGFDLKSHESVCRLDPTRGDRANPINQFDRFGVFLFKIQVNDALVMGDPVPQVAYFIDTQIQCVSTDSDSRKSFVYVWNPQLFLVFSPYRLQPEPKCKFRDQSIGPGFEACEVSGFYPWLRQWTQILATPTI